MSNIVTASNKDFKNGGIKIEKIFLERSRKANVGVGVLPKCRDSSSILGEREEAEKRVS